MQAVRVIAVAGLLFAGASTLAACGSSPAPVALARCSAGQLSVSVGHSGVGLGHVGVVVLVHNVGSAVCTLRGYPTVALVASHGGALVVATKTPSGYIGGLAPGMTTVPLVTIVVGGIASFIVEGTDVPVPATATCPTYLAMLISAPGTSVHKSLRASMTGCSRPQVHPVVAGLSGNASA